MPRSESQSESSPLNRSHRPEATIRASSDGRSGTMSRSKSIAGGRRQRKADATLSLSSEHVGQALQVAIALLIPVLLLIAIFAYVIVAQRQIDSDQTSATTVAYHALDLDACGMAIADELYAVIDMSLNVGVAVAYRLEDARQATTLACASPLFSEPAGYFESVMVPIAQLRANYASTNPATLALGWTNEVVSVITAAQALLDTLPSSVLQNATVGRQTSLLGSLYIYIAILSDFHWIGRTALALDITPFTLAMANLYSAALNVYPETTSEYNTLKLRDCLTAVLMPMSEFGDAQASEMCLPALKTLKDIRNSIHGSVQQQHSDNNAWYQNRSIPIGAVAALSAVVVVAAFVSIFYAQRATTRDLEAELVNRKNTMESIQAFVPAQFLVFLGIRVITELSVDDPQEIHLTVLSSDIRAFTSISEQMTDVELFFWLQEHLELMTAACRRSGGFIEKYIGDAVLCIFEVSADAIRCGIDMQYTVDEANASRVARGEEYMVRVGVGIHSGHTLIGVVGDENCQNTSVVSRAVDMSAKLEELTKVYGAKIIVTEGTFEESAMVIGDTRRLGEFKYDGQSFLIREIFVNDPQPVREYKNGSKKHFEAAVNARDRGNISEANMYFDRVIAFPKPHGYEDLAAVKVIEF